LIILKLKIKLSFISKTKENMTTIYYSVYDRIKNINTQNTGTILNFNNDIYQILYDNGKLVFIDYKDIELFIYRNLNL
jgi:hypothetical protein